MAQSSDLYAVLGVDRGADERDIKKAYFRLIRKYSPEQNPEEFRRIREAYEVLSNPTQRKDYDELTQYGEEVGQHLRAGMEAMERGDLRSAQAEFQEVLTARPDLHMARDMLGMAYLNNGEPQTALSQFEAVCKESPDSASYHLHRGYALYALDRYTDAVVAHQKAGTLDPADSRVQVALSDCYSALEQYDAALDELERAVKPKEDGSPLSLQDFVFLMRKVQIQLLRERLDLADKEIDRIVSVLPDDTEVRRYVSQKIASLSAQLFRLKRSADGNRLLLRAQQVGHKGGAAPDLSFPARVERAFVDLPDGSKRKLETLAKTEVPHKLSHGTWGMPVALAILAVGVIFGGFHEVLHARREWHGNTYIFMALLLLGGPILAVHAIRRILRVKRSTIGRFTSLHPLYLLQTELDKVIAWPLLNLHDVSMTHHLQNGVYQYTSVKADFAGTPLSLSIRGQQAAVEWAQALLDARHRCLGLLAVGMLDEEDAFELLPKEVFSKKTAQSGATQGRQWTVFQSYGVAAICGVALCASGTMYNKNAGERTAWNDTVRQSYGNSLRRYLFNYPNGAHAQEARARLNQHYVEAQTRLAQKDKTSAPGAETLRSLLATLQAAGNEEVRLQIHGKVDLEGLSNLTPPEGVVPPHTDDGMSVESFRRREIALHHAISGMVSRSIPHDLLSFVGTGGLGLSGYVYGNHQRIRGGMPWPRSSAQVPAATLEINYVVRTTGTIERPLYADSTAEGSYFGLRFEWTVRVIPPGTGPEGGVSFVTQPGPRWSTVRYAPYGPLCDVAFEEFAQKLSSYFGLGRVSMPHLTPDYRTKKRLPFRPR